MLPHGQAPLAAGDAPKTAMKRGGQLFNAGKPLLPPSWADELIAIRAPNDIM